jgi:hypothetical protein
MGHKANNCLVRREEYKRKHKRQHAHIAEDEEPPVAVLIHTCKRELEFGSLSVSLEAQCLGSQPTLSL